jgi:hypothetical protein
MATILGDDSAGTVQVSTGADFQVVSLFANGSTTTALGLHIRFHADSSGGNVKGLLYLDEGGGLDLSDRMLVTSEKAVPVGGGTVSWSINLPIQNATNYYLGCVTDSASPRLLVDVVDGIDFDPTSTSYADPTNPWGAGSTHSNSARLNAWLTDTDPFAVADPDQLISTCFPEFDT